MRDLSFCQEPFGEAAQPIASHDPRFLQIVDQAQRERYAEAADAIEALHQEHLFDARLAGYYLFRAFEEDGCQRLPELFDALSALVAKDWSKLLPDKKAPAHLNRSLSWLLQTLLSKTEYHQTAKDATWTRWTEGLTEEKTNEALARAEALHKSLPEPAFHQSIELLGKVLRWLRELASQRKAKPAPAAEEEKRSAPMSAPKAVDVSPNDTLNSVGQALQLRGSPKLVELLNKLKAFELLVERRSFQRAALVGDDLLSAIESFDPRDYFPELFASFGALLSSHVQEISPHWQAKDSVEWKTLMQFYHVDLDRFAKE